MPSFVIDEIYVGDVVNGDVFLRDIGYGELAPEPPRMNPVEPEPIRCTTDVPMCPDGRMARGRGPRCEPICDSPVNVIAPPSGVVDFTDIIRQAPTPAVPTPQTRPEQIILGKNGCPIGGRINDYWANNIRCVEFWNSSKCTYEDYRDGWPILVCPEGVS